MVVVVAVDHVSREIHRAIFDHVAYGLPSLSRSHAAHLVRENFYSSTLPSTVTR